MPTIAGMTPGMDRRDFLRTAAGSALLASGLTAADLGLTDIATAAVRAGPKPRIPGSYRDRTGKTHSLAYFGLHQSGPGPGISAPESFEAGLGRRTAINHSFRQPPEAPWAPLRTRMLRDKRAGRIPMLSYAAGEKPGIENHDIAALARLREITSGSRDTVIDGQARALAALRTPVFLRFTWEFDQRYRGNVGAAAHKAAWRHVRKRFRAVGATNVAFVWCPTWAAFGNGRAAAYYPGDSYVDWIGADGYARTPDYRSFASMFSSGHAFARGRHKPFMVCETGVHRLADQDDDTTGPTEQSAWLDAVRSVLDQDRLTNVKALLYFHVDGDNHPSPNNWKVTEPAGGPASTAFKALAWHPRLKAVR